MSQLPDGAAAALDRMDQIACVWHTLSDLACSRDDLSAVDRDRLAGTLYFLTTEYAQARAALGEAIARAVAP